MVHLIGGAVVGAAPELAYDGLARCLANQGFLVIASPLTAGGSLSFGGLFDHGALALRAAEDFSGAWTEVEARYGPRASRSLKVCGLGHSLGAKLHLLIGSDPELAKAASPPGCNRVANVLVGRPGNERKNRITTFRT